MSGLGPFGAGLSPEDAARLLASIQTPGGMTALDPAAGVYARPAGGDGTWSCNVVVRPTLAEPQSILPVLGRAGIARRWCVQVRAVSDAFAGVAPGLAADFLRVEWIAGFAASRADVDLPAGGAAFEVYAQSLTLGYAFVTQSPNATPRRVVASVSPILGGQQSFPGMYPTRTVIQTVPFPVAPTPFPVPQFASAVAWVLPPIPAAAAAPQFAVTYADENGAGFAQGRALTEWQQLPTGTANLIVTTNPFGAAATLAAVFRLSL